MVRHRIPTIKDTEPSLLNSNLPIKRLVISFLIAVAAITALVLYYSLAQATITLEVKPDNSIIETSLHLGQNGVPAVIKQLELSDSKKFPASPSGDLEDKASGIVTIHNTTNAAQTLIASTRLLSSGNVLFRIQDTVTVPANGQVQVKAVADPSGAAGEVAAGKFTIPGLRQNLQDKIYADIAEGMKRAPKAGNKVTELDIEQAKQSMTDALVPQALSKLREQLATNQKTYAVVYKNEISQASSDVPAGSNASQFTYQLTEKVTAVFYDPVELKKQLLNQVQNNQNSGKKVQTIDEQSLNLILDQITDDLSSADLKVKFLAQVTVTDPNQAFNKYDLLGRTPDEVKNYFAAIPGVGNVTVQLSPFWVTTVPTVIKHITLQIK